MSSPDEHPSCTDVFTSNPTICKELCASYRKNRPAHDTTHCSQTIMAFVGLVGECLYTKAEIDAARRDLARGATR